MLQHYLAKEETQKTAHWCFMRATQSNCCSTLDFFSPKPCPPKAPSWTHWLQDLGSHTATWIWVLILESKRLKQSSSNWLNSDNAPIQRVKNAIFVFPVLPGSAEAQVIWRGIAKCLVFWLLALSVAFLLPKISKSVDVCQSYSKTKVGRSWDTVYIWLS